MAGLNKNFLRGRLSKRVVIRILAASSCITALSIMWQIGSDYKIGVNRIDETIEKIESSTLPILARSLWNLDRAQVRLILDGIARIPDVTGIEVVDANNKIYDSLGNLSGGQGEIHSFSLQFSPTGTTHTIGTLKVMTSLENLNQQILGSMFRIIVSQLLKSMIMTAVIMWIFYAFVTRHLNFLALSVRDVEAYKEPQPIVLMREQAEKTNDELDSVVKALNHLLRDSFEANSKLQASVGERMRIQDELLRAQQELNLGEFAIGVIHDLNNILSIIMGTSYNLDLVWKKISSDMPAKSAAQISDNISRLNSASEAAARVASLLLNHAQNKSEAGSVQLIEVVNNVLLLQEYALKKKGIQINVKIPDNLQVQITKGALMTVLLNLVKNSIEAIESSDRHRDAIITFVAEVSFDLSSVIVWVTDNGPGIPEENRSKMFNHGFTTKESGHGYGLHFCQALLAKFDATIRVSESQLGQGTTFTLILPHAEGEAAKTLTDMAS
jgi:signal transduction histidine kinase